MSQLSVSEYINHISEGIDLVISVNNSMHTLIEHGPKVGADSFAIKTNPATVGDVKVSTDNLCKEETKNYLKKFLKSDVEIKLVDPTKDNKPVTEDDSVELFCQFGI